MSGWRPWVPESVERVRKSDLDRPFQAWLEQGCHAGGLKEAPVPSIIKVAERAARSGLRRSGGAGGPRFFLLFRSAVKDGTLKATGAAEAGGTVATGSPDIEEEFDRRVAELGMEMVELERAGSRTRPIFRLRVDFPDSTPGQGVSVDDCARVSRELEPWLDEHPEVAERYTLEVSSPGIERPLVRRRDFERFRGASAAFRLASLPAGLTSARQEGTIEEVVPGDTGEDYGIRVRFTSGDEMTFAREDILRAHLLWDWDKKGG